MIEAPTFIARLSGSAEMQGEILFSPLNLELCQAQWTCLLGASGVGKSTILRLFAGLETHVNFKGKIESNDGLALAPKIAYMAQSDLLLPWANILDNVMIGAKLRGQQLELERANEILERVGLADQSHKKPTQLSGGQRQRAALARTLMEDKDIILLDEPFSALDAKTRSEMQDLAVDLLKNKTVLLVTHDPAEAARLAHTILVMTRDNLTPMPVPDGAIPRFVDDPKTLQAQGHLLKYLRTMS
jgi:putative hydroxymethylpyrimidine transport system ATP-binding protein